MTSIASLVKEKIHHQNTSKIKTKKINWLGCEDCPRWHHDVCIPNKENFCDHTIELHHIDD